MTFGSKTKALALRGQDHQGKSRLNPTVSGDG